MAARSRVIMSRWKSAASVRALGPSSLAALLCACGCSVASQAPAAFDGARAWKHLQDQVAIGPRVSGTAANARTRDYLIKTLAASGIKAVEQPFEDRHSQGHVKMANVIATLPGQRPERIVIASHFDTKLFDEFRFVGASDGASSTAALLELGRVLKDKPRPFTIELLFLDGEEAVVAWEGDDHTYGSRYYVQDARNSGTLKSLRALILLDMIGDKNLNLRREENSTRWLTDIIWNTARRLGHQQHFLAETLPIEDDHMEFLSRVCGRGSHRSGLPCLAHCGRYARERQPA